MFEFKNVATSNVLLVIASNALMYEVNYLESRTRSYNWDNEKEERKNIVHELSNKYPAISFSVGGEISIDILPKGRDKSQALGDMKEGKNIFIGDRCGLGGNDFEIATMSDKHYNVESWEQTNEILIRLLPKNS